MRGLDSSLYLAWKCRQLQQIFPGTSFVRWEMLFFQLSSSAETASPVSRHIQRQNQLSNILDFVHSEFKQKQIPMKVLDPLRIDRVGFEYGLSVVLDQRVSDYAYTHREFIGTMIFTLDPTIYPDEISGSTTMQTLQPNEELFLSVDAFVVNASNQIRSYGPFVRDCFFSDETLLDKYYAVYSSMNRFVYSLRFFVAFAVCTHEVNVCWIVV